MKYIDRGFIKVHQADGLNVPWDIEIRKPRGRSKCFVLEADCFQPRHGDIVNKAFLVYSEEISVLQELVRTHFLPVLQQAAQNVQNICDGKIDYQKRLS